MKRFRVVFLFWILFLLGSAYSSDNPIDEVLDYSDYSISDISVLKNVPGSYNNPGSLIFYLKVTDSKQTPLSFLSSTNFRLSVGGRPVRNQIIQSSGDGYKITVPRLPFQAKDGTYQLQVSVGSPISGFSSGKRIPVRYHSPLINLILVIDTSTSMLLNDPKNNRQTAVRNIITYSSAQGMVSKVAVIKFSSTASVISPLLPVQDMVGIDEVIQKIDSTGETAIGDALDKAYDELVKTGKDEKTIVILLTDGENNGPWVNNHKKFKAYKTPIYTVGLAGSVNESFLSAISEDSGGEFYQIPDSFKIQSVYSRILNLEINRKTFLSAEMVLKPGQVTNIIFKPDRTISKLNIFGYSSGSGMHVNVQPEIRKMNRIARSNFEAFELRGLKARPHLFRIKNDSQETNTCSLEAYVSARIVTENPQPRKRFALKEPVPLSLLVYQDDVPLSVSVSCRIEYKGNSWKLPLYDDGLHGDDRKNDGVYRNFFFPEDPGNYVAVLNVSGMNLYGERFSRFLRFSFTVSDRKDIPWIVTPLKVDFSKTGSEIDYFRSFELVDVSGSDTSSHSVKLIALPLVYEGKETVLKPSLKPDKFIFESGRKKLFNMFIRFPAAFEKGEYDGRVVMEIGERYIEVPCSVDFSRFRIPENNDFISPLQER